MLYHKDLGKHPEERNRQTRKLIRSGHIQFAGYKKARVYGLLSCASGKKMKLEHRVFFTDEAEALALGYRPCGHCMREPYKKWKAAQR
ncbi:Ada metal-binding domain-containing protein [Niabella sp.]|uniref:Ada metal-binding domain-containing protein n=1 Tax=Niabella sp. TaxID=1962976 RepID=UPI0026134BB4|nr:Ada metal-binding domain-containing protein [Niabella sp.]